MRLFVYFFFAWTLRMFCTSIVFMTFVFRYKIPIWCKFAKFGNLTASFQPENRNVDLLAVPGLGSFSFFIDFYKNSTFDVGLYLIILWVKKVKSLPLYLISRGSGSRLENWFLFEDSQGPSLHHTMCTIENGQAFTGAQTTLWLVVYYTSPFLLCCAITWVALSTCFKSECDSAGNRTQNLPQPRWTC